MRLNFEPINLEKQEDYLEILARCPQITSDYSFLNLWAWSPEYELSWAWDGDLVWIRQNRPDTFLWAPVGAWDAVDWPGRFQENRAAGSGSGLAALTGSGRRTHGGDDPEIPALSSSLMKSHPIEEN